MELLARLDRAGEAVLAYQAALEPEPADAERRLIVRRLRELKAASAYE